MHPSDAWAGWYYEMSTDVTARESPRTIEYLAEITSMEFSWSVVHERPCRSLLPCGVGRTVRNVEPVGLTVTKKLTLSHLEQVAALGDRRQDAASETTHLGKCKAGYARDKLKDTVRKARGALETTSTVLEISPLFTGRGMDRNNAFNGRVMPDEMERS